MTFPAGKPVHIVEEILPEKYGRSSSEYQIVEERAQDGLTFINELVCWRVGAVDGDALMETVIQELKKSEDCNRLMAEVWFNAGTIRIKRSDPIPTNRRKIYPVRSINNYLNT